MFFVHVVWSKGFIFSILLRGIPFLYVFNWSMHSLYCHLYWYDIIIIVIAQLLKVLSFGIKSWPLPLAGTHHEVLNETPIPIFFFIETFYIPCNALYKIFYIDIFLPNVEEYKDQNGYVMQSLILLVLQILVHYLSWKLWTKLLRMAANPLQCFSCFNYMYV